MSMSGSDAGAAAAGVRSRVSNEQLDTLLSFMEEHVEFANGKQSVYSRFSASKLWRLLAERLNAAGLASGGARKSPDKWCRYWADIKYKARKKCGSSGVELSHAEERVQHIISSNGSVGGGSALRGGGGGTAPRAGRPPSEGERRALDDELCSDAEDAGGDAAEARLATEELLAEAAMRSALAAEKQAEAATQAVELLRELVGLWRRSAAAPPPPAQHAPHPPPGHGPHAPHPPPQHGAPPEMHMSSLHPHAHAHHHM